MGINASGKAWIIRGGTALAATMTCLIPATQAQASSGNCFSDANNPGISQVLPGDNTVSVPRQQAANTWQDWIWRGTDDQYVCNPKVTSCTYSYGKSHSTSYGDSVGGQITLGNATSVTKSMLNLVANVIPNWSKTSTDETDYNFSIQMKPGQTAYPYQYIQRRWTQGDFKGAWVNENQTCKVYTSSNPRHPGKDVPGHMYYWDPSRTFGSWSTNREVGRGYGYVVS
ncbi:hypothetical protein AB0I77_27955 [Streptomyces sp. NPDC050619]|uniref:hypothetical protein n=1 Tax=Streptomyces sp. NPDC050619 TaxID=3157214 RepID=UPI0034194DA2